MYERLTQGNLGTSSLQKKNKQQQQNYLKKSHDVDDVVDELLGKHLDHSKQLKNLCPWLVFSSLYLVSSCGEKKPGSPIIRILILS